MLYQRLSPTQWQWQSEGKFYSVRLFADSATLIWSSWTTSSSGIPQFEPGTSQTFEGFIAHAAPQGYHTPPELTEEIRQTVLDLRKKSKPKRSLKDWLF